MGMNCTFEHLTVFPSTACNLSCTYCYLRNTPVENVDSNAVLRGIVNFIKLSPPTRKITFLGGEPLLHGKNLVKWIVAARKYDKQMPIRVFTNGTLLSNDWFAFFYRTNIALTISLDGKKADNDNSRKFKNDSNDFSVYNKILQAVPNCERKNISVCAVITPKNVKNLAVNMLHIGELGFMSAGWTPDITSYWSDEALSMLKINAGEFTQDYISLAKAGRVPFVIDNLYETLAELSGKQVQKRCNSLTLDAQGLFYNCDKLLSAPLEKRKKYSVDIKKTDFLDKRLAFFEDMRRSGGYFSNNACMFGTTARLAVLDLSADEKNKIFESQKKLAELVRTEYCKIASEGMKIPLFRQAHGI